MTGIVRSFAFAAAAVIASGSAAIALDHSARDTGPRTHADSCCVETALLPPLETSVTAERRALLAPDPSATASEARPGLDGADWNCRRPDGSQRCVSEIGTPH